MGPECLCHVALEDGAAAELQHLSDIRALGPSRKCKLLPAQGPHAQTVRLRAERHKDSPGALSVLNVLTWFPACQGKADARSLLPWCGVAMALVHECHLPTDISMLDATELQTADTGCSFGLQRKVPPALSATRLQVSLSASCSRQTL